LPSSEVEEVEVISDPAREELLEELRGDLADVLIEHHLIPGKDLWIRVQTNYWAAFAGLMKEKKGFSYFEWLSAIDWLDSPFGRSLDSQVDKELEDSEDNAEPEEITRGYTGGNTRFQGVARLHSLDRKIGITVKADIDETMALPTWKKFYPGAAWHEREAFEMFGINFFGHENLRKIYLPTGFEGNPLRKDYPLLARMVKPWPGIVDVEPMPENNDSEATPGGATTSNPGPGSVA